jgi:hypothetical protein
LGAEAADVTGQVRGLAQMAAGVEVSRRPAGSKVSHEFHCTFASSGCKARL